MADQGVWKIVGQVGAVAGLISVILGGWWKIEATIDTAVKTSTEVITKDVESSTVSIAREFLEDLKLRLHIVQLEIRALEEEHQPVPERLRMSEELLKERIKDLEQRWFSNPQ